MLPRVPVAGSLIRTDGLEGAVLGGGKTHVVRPRGSRQDPVVWPGCVYAWLCTPARLGNRLTPVNGCPQRIGDPVPSRRTEDLLVGVSIQEA